MVKSFKWLQKIYILIENNWTLYSKNPWYHTFHKYIDAIMAPKKGISFAITLINDIFKYIKIKNIHFKL